MSVDIYTFLRLSSFSHAMHVSRLMWVCLYLVVNVEFTEFREDFVQTDRQKERELIDFEICSGSSCYWLFSKSLCCALCNIMQHLVLGIGVSTTQFGIKSSREVSTNILNCPDSVSRTYQGFIKAELSQKMKETGVQENARSWRWFLEISREEVELLRLTVHSCEAAGCSVWEWLAGLVGKMWVIETVEGQVCLYRPQD